MSTFGLVMPSTEFDPLAPGRILNNRVSFEDDFYKILACGSEEEVRSHAPFISGAKVARIETIDTKTPGYSGQVRAILEIM